LESRPAIETIWNRENVMAPSDETTSRPWAIVLAGGQGTRLAPLVQRIHQDGRPKQYAVLVGSRSLLRRTLDRIALAVARTRTVVVATKSHAPFLAAELGGSDAPKTLVQPSDLGTAAGILLPVHWTLRRDPKAIVAVFPSDHFIADDAAFMRHIAELAGIVERHPARMFLVGATPDSPETGYGWIEPGGQLEGDVRLVRRFWEKPSPETARACMARGCLWNTFVMVARASAIVDAARRALPALDETLARLGPHWDTGTERRAIERIYASAPAANFSESVLAAFPALLAVSTLPPLTWSDWGTPERVLRTLEHQGIVPRWLQPLAPTA
jgi:mannose-1-phosphate guanylyltransferase